MFKDKIDECVHIMTAYIANLKEYYSFIETQIDDFIKKYGEDTVESCLHRIMILLSECGLA
ncbi:hypothetical protein NYR90_14400 [Clostridioides difficile]|nr:hypothetical protein [Clostridioides difficile]UWD47728.1 hypothetical protein NYR90_14400 [Clostridioides difficile]UWI51546.1 hypothetical protein NZ312_07535 [Clostridioides difficile]